MLINFASLALAIATIAFKTNNNTNYVLQLFKFSYSMIASLLIKIYKNISNLKQKYFSLAKKFIFFRNKLDLLKKSSTFLSFINKKLF